MQSLCSFLLVFTLRYRSESRRFSGLRVGGIFPKSAELSRRRRSPFGVRLEIFGVGSEFFQSRRNRLRILSKSAESSRNPFEVGGIGSESFRSWRSPLGILSKLAESARNPFDVGGVLLESSQDPWSLLEVAYGVFAWAFGVASGVFEVAPESV